MMKSGNFTGSGGDQIDLIFEALLARSFAYFLYW
jgi:hypothetical protein